MVHPNESIYINTHATHTHTSTKCLVPNIPACQASVFIRVFGASAWLPQVSGETTDVNTRPAPPAPVTVVVTRYAFMHLATGAANVARLPTINHYGDSSAPLCHAGLYIIRVSDVTAPFLPNSDDSDDSTRQITKFSTVTKTSLGRIYCCTHTRSIFTGLFWQVHGCALTFGVYN